MPPEADVRRFFDGYRRAFETLDPVAIAERFAYPCQITSAADEVAILTVSARADWIASLEHLVGAYRAIGVSWAELLTLSVAGLGPQIAQATVRWRLGTTSGDPIYDFDASYTLADLEGEVRITAIAHNEGPRLQERLAALRS